MVESVARMALPATPAIVALREHRVAIGHHAKRPRTGMAGWSLSQNGYGHITATTHGDISSETRHDPKQVHPKQWMARQQHACRQSPKQCGRHSNSSPRREAKRKNVQQQWTAQQQLNMKESRDRATMDCTATAQHEREHAEIEQRK